MNLLCAVYGHQPVPFRSRRHDGRWLNRCVVCDRPIVHENSEWRVVDDGGTDSSDDGPIDRRGSAQP